MDKLASALLELLPQPITTFIALVVLVFGIVLYTRKINIDERESDNAIEMKRIDSLMAHIAQLNSEISVTRKEMSDLYEMNLQLMGQLREANHKIGMLEKRICELSSGDGESMGSLRLVRNNDPDDGGR